MKLCMYPRHVHCVRMTMSVGGPYYDHYNYNYNNIITFFTGIIPTRVIVAVNNNRVVAVGAVTTPAASL